MASGLKQGVRSPVGVGSVSIDHLPQTNVVECCDRQRVFPKSEGERA
jgi:hypothetical protein